MVIFDQPGSFQWDRGNAAKNLVKHRVVDQECEEAFFDQNKKIFKDVLHSENEERLILLGQTKSGRILFIVFTVRSEKIRVISARDLNRKERHLYG
jgi:uncharacterized DUF497 family protein